MFWISCVSESHQLYVISRIFLFRMLHISRILSLTSYIHESLWPGDAIWQYRSGLTLAQVMDCCLMAPSHDMNQSWLLVCGFCWGIHLRDFSQCMPKLLFCMMSFNSILWKLLPYPMGQWVNMIIISPLEPFLTLTAKNIKGPYYWPFVRRNQGDKL